MPTPTLLEAHECFAAALDELRRNYVTEFELWLKTALADNPDSAQKQAPERSAMGRKLFAEEFLDQRAPPIIREFNRDGEYTILETLRSYEARPEMRQRSAAEARWPAGVWRMVLAAAFGAVVGVILLALQQPMGADAPAPPASTIAATDMLAVLIKAAFVAALGAGIAVFLIAWPPLRPPTRWARNLGLTFAILRAGPLVILLAALLTGLFALIAWLLKGWNPLEVLVGLGALVAILIARWSAVGGYDRDHAQRAWLTQFDEALRADANVWAALAAGLVLRRHDGRERRGPELTDITNIILARRANNETSDAILRVIEQRLGIPPAEAAVRPKPQPNKEFEWKPEHEQYYETYGAVETGVIVMVSREPLFIDGADGTRHLTRRGLVAPRD